MKVKKYLIKILKVTLIICMLFQICIYNVNNVLADDISNTSDFPKDDVVKYNGKINYNGNIVGDFTVGGKQAFCMEHPTATPGTGTKFIIIMMLERYCIMGGKALNNGVALKVVNMVLL